jgi:hypothetical protein
MKDKPLLFALAIGAAAAVGVPLAGCGEEDEVASARPPACRKVEAAGSQYLTTLCDFHAAAAAGKIYDAYGFAEYFPPAQRGAIHAFCFVANRMLEEDSADERFADRAYLTGRITRKAETDMKEELDVVAPGPARRSIGKLNAILELGSLDQDLAERYVKACY